MTPKLVQVGQVIRSPYFSYGEYQTKTFDTKLRGKVVELDRKAPVKVGKHFGVYVCWTEKQVLLATDGLGNWTREIKHTLETSAADPTRGEALFRVVKAYEVAPRRYAHDIYSAGYFVMAVRLSPSGEETREHIQFYQTGGGHSISRIENPEIVEGFPSPFLRGFPYE